MQVYVKHRVLSKEVVYEEVLVEEAVVEGGQARGHAEGAFQREGTKEDDVKRLYEYVLLRYLFKIYIVGCFVLNSLDCCRIKELWAVTPKWTQMRQSRRGTL